MRKPIHPVAVARSELQALRRGWRRFLDDESGGEIDALAEAILALLRRLDDKA